jgi:hypothetical protein
MSGERPEVGEEFRQWAQSEKWAWQKCHIRQLQASQIAWNEEGEVYSNIKLKWSSRVYAGVLTFAVLLLMTSYASAQSTSTILGVIKDTSGGVVPGATITVVNAETSLTRTVTTGVDGSYRIPALPVGRYTVKIDKEGFKPETQQGLMLEVAQNLVVNTTLEVGTAAQEVVVTGEAPLVNTTTSSLGSLVNEERMADLPLNGRNYVDLTLLQPGVAQQVTSSSGGAGISGTWFSANGAPVRSNNFTLDGAMMQNAYGASSGSQAGTTLGVDGIREYKVVTSAYSAEYGLTMGSQMVIVSKSGSNRWSGDVFEYLRNDHLDARNFFDSAKTSPGRRLPMFQRNNFGGSFGGPIKKDKTFFYAVYEGLRQNLGVSINDTVLPDACHNLVPNGSNYAFADQASATACGGTTGSPAVPVLTTSTVIPAAIKPYLDLYPSPNGPSKSFTLPASSRNRVDYGQIRVDQNIGASDSFFGRYTIDDGELNNATTSTATTPSGSAFPQYFRISGASRNQYLTVSETHIFSPSLLNTVRASYSRTNFAADNLYSQDFSTPTYALVTGQPMGTVSITGYTTMGPNGGYPTVHVQNIYTASDDVFYTKGRHALKFGVLFNRYNSATRHTKLLQGQVAFSSLPNFMQGIFNTFASLAAYVPGPPGPPPYPPANLDRDFIYNTLGFYAQDDFRATSRLTLNLGLRYEFQTVPYDLAGRGSRFLDIQDSSQTYTFGPPIKNPGYKNISPRVGFAWDVFGTGKTAVRGGFGIYYDVGNIGSALQQQVNGMPPYSVQQQVTKNPTKQIIKIPLDYSISSEASIGGLQTTGYNIKNPYSYQYNLTVEQQMPGGIGLAVSYVGFTGRQLWHTMEANPVVPTSITDGVKFWGGSTRVNPDWSSAILTTTGSNAWYNSLQVVANKRLSRGLQFQSAYTYSHALDTTSGQMYASDCGASGGLQGLDPFNPDYDKGPSCFDARHNWHFNLLYHIPDLKSDNFMVKKVLNGWWLGNIVNIQSGYPFTPVLSVNRSGSGVFGGRQGDRPNLGTDTVAPGQTGAEGSINTTTSTFVPFDPNSVIIGDPNMWFNPLMFRLGPTGYLGNASRNMLRGPGLGTWNISFNKDTALGFLGENGKLQFRAEIFNILNRANFNMPSGTTFQGKTSDPAGPTESPVNAVAQIKSTATTSRQIQLALKLIF